MKIKLVNSSSQPKHCFKVADRTDEGKCFWILEEYHDLFLFLSKREIMCLSSNYPIELFNVVLKSILHFLYLNCFHLGLNLWTISWCGQHFQSSDDSQNPNLGYLSLLSWSSNLSFSHIDFQTQSLLYESTDRMRDSLNRGFSSNCHHTIIRLANKSKPSLFQLLV